MANCIYVSTEILNDVLLVVLYWLYYIIYIDVLYWLPYFMQMDLPAEEPDRLSNKLLQYDPRQDQWTERAPMKYSKYRFSTAVVNSEIYVLGKKKQIAKRV